MAERLVTDNELERALDWLRDNAREIGEAKRQTIITERMVRHIKALEMKKYSELPVSAQEREALASDRYKQACYEEAVAAGRFEEMRALREAATLKIAAWQTENANLRSMKIL